MVAFAGPGREVTHVNKSVLFRLLKAIVIGFLGCSSLSMMVRLRKEGRNPIFCEVNSVMPSMALLNP